MCCLGLEAARAAVMACRVRVQQQDTGQGFEDV